MLSSAASPDAVRDTLRRVMPERRLTGIPRQAERRAIVLALVAHDLQRRHAYAETELNEALTRCLARWRADVDHVTCRRYLVDLGFVKRDRAGQRYLLNFPRVEATLSPEAREQAPALLEDALKPKRKLKGA